MGVPLRKNVYLTTQAENTQYAGHHATFIATTGALAEHLAWHGSHGSGSDAHFLFWHRYYLRKLEDYLGLAMGSPATFLPVYRKCQKVRKPARADADRPTLVAS